MKKFRQKKETQAGFTLIELMVVIVILGILAGLIIPRVMGRPDEARQAKAKIQMESLESALKLYKLDNGPLSYNRAGTQSSGGIAHRRQSTEKLASGRLSGKRQSAQRPVGK